MPGELTHRAWRAANVSRRGSLLVPVLLFAVMLAGASAVYSTTVTSGHGLRMRELRELRLELAAEAGLADALASLRTGGSGVIGSAQQPVDFGGLSYYTELRNTGGDRWSLVSVGLKGRARHALERTRERPESSSSSRAASMPSSESSSRRVRATPWCETSSGSNRTRSIRRSSSLR